MDSDSWSYLLVFLIPVLLILSFLSFYTVQAGHVGVYHLFGKVNDVEKQPGFHVKNPLASVEKFSVKTQEYTMSGKPDEGEKNSSNSESSNDAITALSKEGMEVDLDVTVWYRVQPEKASDIYKTIGTNYRKVIVRPKIRESIRSLTASYEAKKIYSEQRDDLQNEIKTSISETLDDRGIIVEKVLLRNVKLPDKVTSAIESKIEAEQDAQKMEFVIDKEKKEAERKRIEAQGIADSNEIIDKSLSEQYLRWYWIQEGINNNTIYIPTGRDGMPMFKEVE